MPHASAAARVLAVLIAIAACAPARPPLPALQRMGPDQLEQEARVLERRQAERPRDAELRIARGEVYYLLARDALDRLHDEGRYLAFLERSVDEFVTALEIDPRNDQPHFYLAVIDTYRGNSLAALRGLSNAKHLKPTPIAYTNIAEMYVYRGRPDLAREWNDLGLRRGAPWGPVAFNRMLIAWREGDLYDARQHFDVLARTEPEMVRTINMARLPTMPRSFEEFAGYCCGSPACGPYMRPQCLDLSLAVREREISEETVLKELRLEIEAKRRLRKLYEQRKELEVTIDDPDAE